MSVVPTDAQPCNEKLLSDLLNENTSDILPQSRNEAFLLGLINKVVPDITPVSRVECYLKALCEKNAGDGGGGTTDHSKLANRDAADQHPMSAITGLEAALRDKQPTGDYLTRETDPTVPAWAKEPTSPVTRPTRWAPIRLARLSPRCPRTTPGQIPIATSDC